MNSERPLPVGVQAAFENEVVKPVVLIEADFSDGIVRLWSGLGTREFLGETWRGVGSLLSIPSVRERTDGGIDEITVNLSGLDSNIFDSAVLGDYQNRPCSVRVGALSMDETTLYGPLSLFSGVMDEDSIEDDGQEVIVSIKGRSRDGDKANRRPWMFSNEDQLELYPGDVGLSRMTEIQGRDLEW